MSIKKLIYIANARLPTEKAHGYQICKMCEAFAQKGLEVMLFHPRRPQENVELKEKSVFDYYGVSPLFAVRSLPNWDIVTWETLIPSQIFSAFFLLHGLLWGLYASLIAKNAFLADLYYTRNSYIAFWLTQLRMPTVYEVHAIPKKGQKYLIQQLAGQSQLKLTVALTSFIKQELVAMGFPEEKILVLPDSVDLAKFTNLPTKEECRQKLGLPENRWIIGYIGRFRTMEMEKGIPELVQAMVHLPPMQDPEPLLLCVGGPMETIPSYLQLANELDLSPGRLQFGDRVPNREVPLWMKACDCLTIPWQWTEFSAYYTSPMKLFEYMAVGVPIIASDLPSLKEVLRHEENALLVEAGNPKAIANKIQLLSQNRKLASQIVQQANLDIQQYTWKLRAEQVINSIDKI